jgi:signal transduction histidine kinase
MRSVHGLAVWQQARYREAGVSEVQAASTSVAPRRAELSAAWSETLRYVWAVLLLGASYYGAAKLGQTLHYTASVSAIWPPVGLGIAALYLWGLGLWPGIFLGECLVNANQFFEGSSPPLGSLAGQQLGNMAEVILGAWLLSRLIGRRAALDRTSQVIGLIVAVGTATAISATVGTVSMLAGDVIQRSAVPTFWRTWWLGDSAGALIVLPLVLTWLGHPRAALRRMWRVEGLLMLASVAALATVGVTSSAPVTYLIFPALIWAAFRFGPPGVTLANAINALLTIALTADRVGAFFKQPISNRTLSTQLYVLIASLTALFLSAVVSERARGAADLAEARRRENERARQERLRIARELHDTVSQSLFSSVLHTRAAQKALDEGRSSPALRDSLTAIAAQTKRAQLEMRTFIFEWGPDGAGEGLLPAIERHGLQLKNEAGLEVDVRGPAEGLPLTAATQTHLYAIVREALGNCARHSGAGSASVRIQLEPERVVVEVADTGLGFDPDVSRPGHFGLDSMKSRAREIGATLSIGSARPGGTIVRVEMPTDVD